MILFRLRSQSVYTYTSHTNMYIQWPLQLLLWISTWPRHAVTHGMTAGALVRAHMAVMHMRKHHQTGSLPLSINFHLRFPSSLSFLLTSSHPCLRTVTPFSRYQRKSSFITTAGMTHWLSHSNIMERKVLGSLWCESHKSEQSVLHWWTWWRWNETRCVRCDGEVQNLPPEYRADKRGWTEQKR